MFVPKDALFPLTWQKQFYAHPNTVFRSGTLCVGGYTVFHRSSIAVFVLSTSFSEPSARRAAGALRGERRLEAEALDEYDVTYVSQTSYADPSSRHN